MVDSTGRIGSLFSEVIKKISVHYVILFTNDKILHYFTYI